MRDRKLKQNIERKSLMGWRTCNNKDKSKTILGGCNKSQDQGPSIINGNNLENQESNKSLNCSYSRFLSNGLLLVKEKVWMIFNAINNQSYDWQNWQFYQ